MSLFKKKEAKEAERPLFAGDAAESGFGGEGSLGVDSGEAGGDSSGGEKAEPTSILKKEIFAGKGSKQRLPKKRTMNLYVVENDDNSLSRVLPVAIILGIAIAIFCKFAVIDRIQELNEAQSLYDESSAQLAELNEALEDYPEVREKYVRYTDNYMNQEEALIVSRIDVINMLDAACSGFATIESVSAVDNSLSVEVVSANLDNVAYVKERLDANEYVQEVRVYTAESNMQDYKSSGKLKSSLLITIADPNAPVQADAADTDADDAGTDAESEVTE